VSKLRKFNWLSSLLIAVGVLLLTNCEDDNNSLGMEVQPPNDKLQVITSDTASIIAYSQLVDSIKTDETSLSLLGSMADPVFGFSTASFYTQFRLSQSAFSFGILPVPDSLVLKLDYDGFYGDSTDAMMVRVYELDEQIEVDSAYYSNMSLAHKPVLLAEKTFVPDFENEVVVWEDTLDPHLRINLTDLTYTLAIKLLEAPADSLASNSSFLNYFYGLYVEAEPVNSGGAILYFDLLSSLSEMVLYYHNQENDSLKFSYVINSNCGRFGHFDHDYTQGSAEFVSQVLEKDTTLGKNTCYVQALGGVKTFIRFPTLKNYYTNGSIAVNEARFFLSCYETEPELDIANLMIMVKKKSDGSYTILDDQLNGERFFGGYYDENLHGYWFRITSTVQDMMREEEPDYGFEIYLSGGAVNAERVILNGSDPAGPDTEDSRMRLVITYTTIN
jgi:hypothetical protein